MKRILGLIGKRFLIIFVFICSAYGREPVSKDSLAFYYLDLKNLQDENASILSPDIFLQTIVSFKKANSAIISGDSSAYRVQLSKIRNNIYKMRKIVKSSMNTLGPVFTARKKALYFEGNKYAEISWNRAEQFLKTAVSELDNKNDDDLVYDVNQAIENYKFSIFIALKKKYLSDAVAAINKAKKAEADRWAPISFKNAVRYLKKAEQVINEMPNEKDTIKKYAFKSEGEASAAEEFASIIKNADGNPERFEQILINNAKLLRKYANIIGLKGASVLPADTLLEIELHKLVNERKMLISEMVYCDDEINELKSKMDSCYEKQRAEKEFNRKISLIKSMFENENSQVLIANNDLIIRIFGVKFSSDDSYIPPEYFGVLNKAAKAVGEFVNMPITVEVHTDSNGSAAANRRISAKRAEAVKDFLLKNLEAENLNIRSIGRGESKPISSNTTKKGRELNRRIEVIIQLRDSH